MNLAPVAVSTYSRLNHLERTISALSKNKLADQSDLYILSDAPKPGDELKVAAVREYVESVKGFKSVSIIKRKTNARVFNNRDGINQLLAEHGKVIFLEEDVVTAPGFLKFINSGLTVYQERQDIFAVCGYTPPIEIPAVYRSDIIISPRFSTWGFGIWKERFDSIIYDKSEYLELLNDPGRLKQFRQNGEDLVNMLRREAEGTLDAMDVKIFFTQFVKQQFVVCPSISLTLNIGHDGTGTHCGKSNRFDVRLPDALREFKLEPDLAPDPEITRRLYFFRSRFPQSAFPRAVKRFLYLPLKNYALRPFKKAIGRLRLK